MDDRVKVINSTIQEFMGVRFYLCGHYYQNKGKRLHRSVWEFFNGEIPEGYHIHHIDGDRNNNNIENLALMPGLAHTRMHAVSEDRRENGRRAIVLAIKVAPEWHHSKEGKEWHSKHAKETWAKHREPHEKICTGCGAVFMSNDIGHKGNHFCSQNCKARYYRRTRNANKKH